MKKILLYLALSMMVVTPFAFGHGNTWRRATVDWTTYRDKTYTGGVPVTNNGRVYVEGNDILFIDQAGTISSMIAGAGGGAPTNAGYITKTADATLSNEFALGSLATGLLKNTTTTGIPTIGVEGTDYYGPSGTDVAVADGGTGASTAQAAINTLTAVSGATNEHVLTKDTGTGNAIWKASAGGGSGAFDDSGDPAVLNTPSKDVVIGPSHINTSKLAVDGDADFPVLSLQQNSTQTDAPFIIETSAGTEIMTVEPGGLITTALGLDGIGAIDLPIGSADITGIDFTMGTAAGNDLTVNTTDLVVEGDNKRVGIGTASPKTALQISNAEPTLTLVDTTNDIEALLTNSTNVGHLVFRCDNTDDADATDPAIELESGSAATTMAKFTTGAITFSTDGTGTAEVVLPDGSIDTNEILNDTIVNADVNSAAAIDASKLESTVIIVSEIDTFSELDTIVADEGLVGDTTTNTLTNKTLNSSTNDIHADSVHETLRNESGGTINRGDAVYISGYSVGQDLALVTLADSDSSATMPCVALVEDSSVSNNSTGQFIEVGTLSDFDTSSWSVGDSLYISGTGTTGNTLTNVKPTGTSLVQKIGEVLRSHATLGVIEVFGAGRANDLPNIANTKIWIGDASGVPQEFTLSGNVTITAGGVVSVNSVQANSVALTTDTTGNYAAGDAEAGAATNIQDDLIVNADVNSAAAISVSKTALVAGTSLTLSTDTLNVDDDFLANDGDVGTGVYDFGGTTSFEITNSATPTVNADGEIALDTTITSHDGLIIYYQGAEAMVIPAIPLADLTTTDGHVIDYNSAGSKFTMDAPAAGGETNSLEVVTTGIAATEIPIGTAADTVVYAALSGGATMTSGGVVTLQSASTTQSGASELATTAEIDTGTDSTRSMPVDQFVASKRNIRYVNWRIVADDTDTATATTKGGDFECPFSGTIVSIGGYVDTAGTTGTMTIDVNLNGTTIMTTNKITIDTTEKSSRTAATAPVLTTTAVTEGDLFTCDIDAIHTTAAKGTTVRFGIRE